MTLESAIAAIATATREALATEHFVVAFATAKHRSFVQAVADRSDAADAAAAIAQVERRPCEVHTLVNDRVVRIVRHHPDGAIELRAVCKGETPFTGVIL